MPAQIRAAKMLAIFVTESVIFISFFYYAAVAVLTNTEHGPCQFFNIYVLQIFRCIFCYIMMDIIKMVSVKSYILENSPSVM